MPPTTHGLSDANTCCRRTPTTASCPAHLKADVNRALPTPRPKYVERAILKSIKEKDKPTFVQSKVADGPGEGPSIPASLVVRGADRANGGGSAEGGSCIMFADGPPGLCRLWILFGNTKTGWEFPYINKSTDPARDVIDGMSDGAGKPSITVTWKVQFGRDMPRRRELGPRACWACHVPVVSAEGWFRGIVCPAKLCHVPSSSDADGMPHAVLQPRRSIGSIKMTQNLKNEGWRTCRGDD